MRGGFARAARGWALPRLGGLGDQCGASGNVKLNVLGVCFEALMEMVRGVTMLSDTLLALTRGGRVSAVCQPVAKDETRMFKSTFDFSTSASPFSRSRFKGWGVFFG